MTLFNLTRTPNPSAYLTTRLVVAALIMIAAFYFGFTARYPLANYIDNDFTGSIGVLNQWRPEGAYLYIGVFALLFIVYLLVARWINTRPEMPPRTVHRLFGMIFASGVLFNLVLVPQYTYEAMDIYDLIIRGRMTAYYGLNPLSSPPDVLKNIPSVTGDEGADPVLRFAEWQQVPSAYGAGWELTAAAAARTAGHDLTTNIYLFKLIQIAAYAVTLLVIYLTLRIHAPDRALLGAVLFGWNPFVVGMIGGGGHNDALMAMFLAISLYFLARRWLIAAVLAAAVGATVKFIPLLLFPILLLIAFRTLNRGVFIRFAMLSAVGSAMIIGLIYAPFFTGQETTALLQRRTLLYTSTYGAVLRQALGPVFDNQPMDSSPYRTPRTNTLIIYGGYLLAAGFGLLSLRSIWLRPTFDQAVETSGYILLFYLIVTTSWFQSWYLLWIIPLAALMPDRGLRRIMVVFSYLVTWQTLIYNYYSLKPPGFAPLPWRDLLPVSVFMGGTYLYAVWALVIHPRLSRHSSRNATLNKPSQVSRTRPTTELPA